MRERDIYPISIPPGPIEAQLVDYHGPLLDKFQFLLVRLKHRRGLHRLRPLRISIPLSPIEAPAPGERVLVLGLISIPLSPIEADGRPAAPELEFHISIPLSPIEAEPWQQFIIASLLFQFLLVRLKQRP